MPEPGEKLKAVEVAPTFEGDFVVEDHLRLECGRSLVNPVLHYAIYGELNAARDNVVLVGHALSGSALVGSWWPELFAPGGLVDLERDCAICVNLLGSCYGSTGPASINPESFTESDPEFDFRAVPSGLSRSGRVYGPDFPLVSIRDNVRAQARLLDSLGIARIRVAIGGSIGGMQALEWSILFPDRVKRAVIIAVAPLSAMGIALNHLQRLAIIDDPEWRDGIYSPGKGPRNGLALARQIGILSYKSPELFNERFGRKANRNGEEPFSTDSSRADGRPGLLLPAGLVGGRFDVAGYLDYQGERFLERFDANAYLAILRTMDTWDPRRGFRDEQEVYGRIRARLMFVGISSDRLFPPEDVAEMARAVRAAGARAEYREMTTGHGHDAFLAEQGALVKLLQDWD